jgi:hypothetical protein
MRKTIMRFIVALLPLAAVFSLASCQKAEFDLQDPEPSALDGKTELQEVIVTASIADATSDTRTSYNEGEGKNYWSPGDKIRIFSDGQSSVFTSLNTEPETMVKFKGLISFVTGTSNEDEDSKDYVWGLYPNDENAYFYAPNGVTRNAQIMTTLPILQTGVAGTFGDNLTAMIGRSESLSIPFRGAYSGAFFKVNRSDIVSMTLRGLNGEALSGTPTFGLNSSLLPVVLSLSNPKTSVTVVAPNGTFEPGQNYYIITLPDVALPNGYSVTLRRSDGYEGTYEVRANRPLNRIKFRNLSDPVDVRIENPQNIANGTSTGWVMPASYIPLNEIHYTTTDGEEIQYNATYLSSTGNELDDENCVAPADNGGVGIIRFTAPIAEIDFAAFEGATNLETVAWPPTVVSIGGYAFKGCENLEEVSFDNINSIGLEAFMGSGIRELVLPEGVQSVGMRAFSECANLETVTLPQSLTELSQTMFTYCPNLRAFNGAFASDDHRCLFGNLTYQGKAVFAFAPAGFGPDDTYIVPEGVASISSYAFAGYDIGRVILPESLNTISTYAFYGCSSLKDVTIPANVDRIYVHAFENCTGLQWIKIQRTGSVVESRGGRVVTNTNDCPIYVPSDLLDQYKTAQNWVYFADRFKAKQPDYAIWYTTTDGAAASYILPEAYQGYASQIQNIAPNNNNNAPGIGWLKFPINLTEIPEGLFRNRSNLQTVSIPEGVTKIGSSAFKGCTNLENVEFGSSVEFIDTEAFDGCNLSFIHMPNSVNNLGQSCFGNNPLTTVRIPDNLTTIALNPFTDCSNLVSFTGDNHFVADEGRCLIDSDGTLYSYASAAVANGYAIPSSVKYIEDGSFRSATFKSVMIPATVESLGGWNFVDCPNLTTVEIRGGENLTIGTCVLRNCPQLRRINMASAVPPSINEDTFFSIPSSGSPELGIPETCQIAIPGAGSLTYYTSSYPNWNALWEHFFFYQANNEIWYHYASNSVSATLRTSGVDYGAQHARDFVLIVSDRSKFGSIVPFPSSIELNSDIAIGVASFDSNVTKIPEDVFSSKYFHDRYAVDWVSLPGQVTTIGNRAFKGASSLLTFPVGPNYVLTTIGDEAFMDCSSMVNGGTGSYAVSLPSSVTTIGARAFKNCSSIQRAYATGATSIGNAAFESCSNLLFSRLGNGLTEIADSVFYRCSKLEGVFLSNPSSVTSIGVASFQNASMLKTVGSESNVGKVNMPGVTEVKDYAFYNCSNIENVQMANLLTVNESSFSGLADVTFSLPKLETINGWYSFGSVVTDHLYLPSLKNAGSACFIFGYSKINKITFGPGLESLPYDSGIWGFCFNNVTSTVHIYFWGTTPPVIGPNTFRSDYNDPSVLADIRFHVLGGYKEVYKSALHNASSLYDNYYSKIYDDIEDPN